MTGFLLRLHQDFAQQLEFVIQRQIAPRRTMLNQRRQVEKMVNRENRPVTINAPRPWLPGFSEAGETMLRDHPRGVFINGIGVGPISLNAPNLLRR